MIKKQYLSPTMEIYENRPQQKLLFGSLIDDVNADTLFEDGEQDHLDDNPTVNMWEDAW
jgi:hypothetical protein